MVKHASPTLALEAVDTLNRRLEGQEPREILTWAWERFGDRLAATSSFQTQSVPLLHMISRACPQLTIYFLDTGFHFPETLSFRALLARHFRLRVIDLQHEAGHDAFLSRHGQLYSTDPELCCYLNKVEPMERLFGRHQAWLTGIRRDQTESRARIPVIDVGTNGIYKIAPLANWTNEDVDRYLQAHRLPRHPLSAQGYRSIGCQPCTRAVGPDAPEREGRWHGSAKTECGLHDDYWRRMAPTKNASGS
jgi:phosphoadenosine phosphosulfate reductase